MVIKEGTGYSEHWVLHATNKSLNSTLVTNNTVYVSYIEIKYNFFFKKAEMDL